MDGSSYLDQPLGEFLDALASREPAPGGGAVTATVAGMAAGLAAMAARFSADRLADAADTATRADRLRERAGELADRDAQAYREVIAAYRLPREPDPDSRRERIRAALGHAAQVPADIAAICAEVAELAARVAAEGNPNLAGDTLTALLLAQAAARAAARLVRINVDSGQLGNELPATVEGQVARADAAVAAVRSADTAGGEPGAP